MQRKIIFTALTCLLIAESIAQSKLSVEYIMRDPIWMGNFPSSPRWSEDSKQIYFQYRAENDPADSLHKIFLNNTEEIQKVTWPEEKKTRRTDAAFNEDKSLRIFREDQKLQLENMKNGEISTILEWHEEFRNPTFLADKDKISFVYSNNLYVVSRKTGSAQKVTKIDTGSVPKEEDKSSESDPDFLEAENLGLLNVVRERKEKQEKRSEYYRSIRSNGEKEFTHYTSGKTPSNLKLSPDGKFASFSTYNQSSNKNTFVPDYVAASGYTEELNSRPKVGTEPTISEVFIYDLERDTVFTISASDLPGIDDLPDYVSDYPDQEWEKKERDVTFFGPLFSPDGKHAILQVRSLDNKDRWITKIDLETGELETLDRQRDEAWVEGPGIGYVYSGGTLGWLPDNEHIYFQSEKSGYSHLYLLNLESRTKTALTSGEFEVFEPFISKDQKNWYFTSSEVDLGERHFYRMPLMGGEKVQLTSMEGNNDVSLSPDEKNLLILHSFSNRPEELYLQENNPNSTPKKLTSGQSEEFKGYDWRVPELVRFTAKDGAEVPARLYSPDPVIKNGAAVIFVHGAGYLQNVHKWWSSYFREYMFHNLLTDLGYTVLDIDYRGSSGYGRDWRTGIYRHMGGKDLSDQVDGAKYLIASQGVDQDKIGIYGGSYGGFITLMALFNESETFASGAALRSVTDWAHYNHGYTSNILNTPEDDPIAYRRSSPIYFAEGLKGNLLIAHGMVDRNVHFQDVVRLSQRLIELGKTNWEMAVYPVEDHGFVEPSSWTDEYSRILDLFNSTLLQD